jgi:alpha-beta hydrolase superfamily lysophospholipase
VPTVLAPDGASLAYEAHDAKNAATALLVVPGWSDHAGRYGALAQRLAAAGVATYAMDLRGHGRSAGRRAHLTRFSQLLGDLQAFRRAVRQRTDAAQVLLGHGFGGLVVLRYLETQPPDVLRAAIVSSPFLGPAQPVPLWRQLVSRVCVDLWPTIPFPLGRDPDHVSRDPAVCAAFATDPHVEGRYTAGAWSETQWAQRAVVADAHRIECPLLFLLAGEDRLADAHLARAFADGLRGRVEVRWHPEMYHELLSDPQRERVISEMLAFVGTAGSTGP